MQETWHPGSVSRLGRSPPEGYGNSLQYSCLENPKDRGESLRVWHNTTRKIRQCNSLYINLVINEMEDITVNVILPKIMYFNRTLIKISNREEQDGRGVGGHRVHFSPWILFHGSGIHLQTQKCVQNTSWKWTGAPDQWKRIYITMQNSVGWRN